MGSTHEMPTILCPYCRIHCDADWVDVGVGMIQCGPYHCEQCGASEIGPNDEPRELTPREEKHGWYGPNSKPGSSANVIGGKHVSHVAMRETYKDEFTGNTLWYSKTYVSNWWKNIRSRKE